MSNWHSRWLSSYFRWPLYNSFAIAEQNCFTKITCRQFVEIFSFIIELTAIILLKINQTQEFSTQWLKKKNPKNLPIPFSTVNSHTHLTENSPFCRSIWFNLSKISVELVQRNVSNITIVCVPSAAIKFTLLLVFFFFYYLLFQRVAELKIIN